MREECGAQIRRAVAAVAVSVALHVAIVALSGSVLIGALLIDDSGGTAPLVIDVIAPGAAAAVRPVARSARGETASASRSARGHVPSANRGARGDAPSAARGTAIRSAAVDSAALAEPPIAEAVAAGASASSLVDELAERPESAVTMVGDAPGAGAASGMNAADPGQAAGSAGPETAAPAAVAASAEAPTDELADSARAAAVDPDVAGAAAGPDVAGGAIAADAEGARTAAATPFADPRVNLTRLGEVTRNPSVSARAEGQPFVGRREVFEFLLDHPDFATHVARALRLARYRMWRTGDDLHVDDGWGATGRVFVVYAASGTRVLYARGEFQSGLLPAIPGEAVVTITYDAQPGADGRELLSTNISSQLKIGGALGDLVVRVASSLATEKAERESHRLVRTFARVLQAVDEKPAALYATLLGRPDVPQRELEQFRVLLKLP
jgi:hypothetical protein